MRFNIRYLDEQQRIQETHLNASSEEEVRLAWSKRHTILLACVPETKLQHRYSGFSVLLFAEELHSLLKAGLNLAEAVYALNRHAQQHSPHGSRALLMHQLTQSLQRGACFSEALRETEAFPEILIASVEASESSGGIPEALSRFAQIERERHQLQEALISGSIYPLLVFGVGAAVILFLMLYVIPRFSVIFIQMHHNLPWTTQLLMEVGLWIDQHRQLVVSSLIIAFITIIGIVSLPSCRTWCLHQILQFPFLKKRAIQFECTRFYRTLGTLLEAGLSLTQSLSLCQSVLMLPKLKTALNQAKQSIEQGEALHKAFSTYQLIDAIGEQLLTAAEGRGQLASAFEHLALWTESELRRTVTRILRVLEPVMMVLIGGFVGLIVVLMYMPLFELTGNVL